MYRYDDAIKEFSALTAESGDYPASLYYAGESYQMKGDQISSIEYYQKVQAQFPSHELADKALLNMGRLYLNQKKGAQALDSAVRIIKYYKDRDTIDDAYYLIGKVYEKDPRFKDVETARKIYKKFITKGESDARFGKSPLLVRVREDLQRIEKTYFKMEK
jgi:outer membrane protein assembly factor BamD (BamD/ComL family)